MNKILKSVVQAANSNAEKCLVLYHPDLVRFARVKTT